MSSLRGFFGRLWGIVTLVCLAAAAGGGLRASEICPPLPEFEGNVARPKRLAEFFLCRALAQPTQLEFIETPLQDVVNYLKDYHAIEIQLDSGCFPADVAVDTPITVNLSGVSLGSALGAILGKLDLTYAIQDEVLLITTPERASKYKSTRLYPVGDLLAEDGSAESLQQAARAVVEPGPAARSQGGPGPQPAVFRGRLIVYAPQLEHEKVEDLLAQLRAALKLDPPEVAHPLETLEGERHLSLYRFPVCDRDLGHLREGTQLESLDIGGTLITDQGLAHLAKLSGLERLNIGSTGVTDEGLRHLGPLVNLEYLGLDSTYIKGDGLHHLQGMSRLKTLRLDRTSIRDPKPLLTFTSLRELSLGDTEIDDAGVKQLAGLTRLVNLSLAACPITDETLGHLAGLKNLRRLNVARRYSELRVRDLPAFSVDASQKLRQALPNCHIIGLPTVPKEKKNRAGKEHPFGGDDPFAEPGVGDPFAPKDKPRPEPEAGDDPFSG